MKELFAEKISKSFSGKILFKDLTIKLNYGNLLLIHGPNGVGKSTLLKVILGVISADSGRQEYLKDNNFRNIVGYASSNPNSFFNRLSVMDNLLFFLTIRGFSKNDSINMISQFLEKLNIDPESLKKEYMYLSLGDRKKISLLRSLVHDPKIILFDEPMSSLDAKSQKSFKKYIAELSSLRNKIVIIVTHNINSYEDIYTHSLEMQENESLEIHKKIS